MCLLHAEEARGRLLQSDLRQSVESEGIPEGVSQECRVYSILGSTGIQVRLGREVKSWTRISVGGDKILRGKICSGLEQRDSWM